MKSILALFLVLIVTNSVAQKYLTTSSGIIFFEASVPLFEAVEAKNELVKATLNPKKGQIYIEMQIKNFHFEKSLMEEHFNSYYMESDQYPKATFKGLIEKFELNIVSSNPLKYKIKGRISIHGKSKGITVNATIKKINDEINLTTNFSLNTDDFDIEIPYLVRSKLSKNVNVNLNCNLK